MTRFLLILSLALAGCTSPAPDCSAWKRRALEAEARVAELTQQLAAVDQDLLRLQNATKPAPPSN